MTSVLNASRPRFVLVLAIAMVVLASCSTESTSRPNGTSPQSESAAGSLSGADGGALRVVATTTIVGDIVARIGGDRVGLTVLLPIGADPHGFQPTPRDVVTVADADVVFVNGLGLETFLEPLLDNAGGAARVVSVSEGVETQVLAADNGYEEDGRESGSEEDADGGGTSGLDEVGSVDGGGTSGLDEVGSADEQAGVELHLDPHVWFNPDNVAVWAANIAATLAELDPDSAGTFEANARAVAAELSALDDWIAAQTSTIPPQRRGLVSDHDTLGYFASAYGFERIGTLRGFSTMAEPSAADLARLEDAIRTYTVPAIFVGTTVNPALAERVAKDTGVRVVRLYTGSLSEPGGPADHYEAFMRFNVSAIRDGLAPSPSAAPDP